MKKHIRTIALLITTLFLAATAARADVSIAYFDTIKSDPAIAAGKTYCLRHNLMFEKDTWNATNYWRGTLLPINTKVTVVTIGNSSMLIKWDGGSLTIANNGYTKVTMAELAKRMLSPNPVPIEKFGKEMAANITSGSLMKGMTREQIIMTRGWPPAHKTPAITSDNAKWTYWSSKFITESLVISGGKLVAGRNVKQ